jgi:hypothetical protein
MKETPMAYGIYARSTVHGSYQEVGFTDGALTIGNSQQRPLNYEHDAEARLSALHYNAHSPDDYDFIVKKR